MDPESETHLLNCRRKTRKDALPPSKTTNTGSKTSRYCTVPVHCTSTRLSSTANYCNLLSRAKDRTDSTLYLYDNLLCETSYRPIRTRRNTVLYNGPPPSICVPATNPTRRNAKLKLMVKPIMRPRILRIDQSESQGILEDNILNLDFTEKSSTFTLRRLPSWKSASCGD